MLVLSARFVQALNGQAVPLGAEKLFQMQTPVPSPSLADVCHRLSRFITNDHSLSQLAKHILRPHCTLLDQALGRG
eukprot:m.50278 g.50278  ORF g.50278 m.50278 type:complete len:76 (-) comp13409_c0_seq3:115-342(-)